MSTIYALSRFIADCDTVMGELNSAHSMEMLDACTSNNSLIGFGVSCLSSSQNLSVAQSVDNLQQEAHRINQMLAETGIFNTYACRPICTNFTGSHVRNAENAEHSLFANLFTGWGYSDVASYNTMNTISQTRQQVSMARNDAIMLQNYMRNRVCNDYRPAFSDTCSFN